MKLTREFYLQEDVVQLAKSLLGKVLYTDIGIGISAGMIVETEAYRAPEDKASHAYNNRRTERTELMYKEGGHAYVYLCYGIHNLFNIVSNKVDIPHAILVRAIQPVEGVELMLKRRNKQKLDYGLSSGPGLVSLALGIERQQNGADLTGNTIWLEDNGTVVEDTDIIASPRVGVSYAQEWAATPWRFRIRNNPWTGKAK